MQSPVQPIRVLHLLSAEPQTRPIERAALRGVLSEIPRRRVAPQIVRFAKGDAHGMALKMLGVEVHELGARRQPLSSVALRELRAVAEQCRPHILHAWDYPAQLASLALQDDLGVRLVWSMTATRPPSGLLNGSLRSTVKDAARADAVVYTSRLSATAHHDAGFPADKRRIVEPGVDAELYKPDFAARRRVRAQWQIPTDAFVIGMHAPLTPQLDHAALIATADELARSQPQLHVLLAGTQVDTHNPALGALVRAAKHIAGRVHAVGNMLDMAELYSGCDVACAIASDDSRRLDVVAAMLCGVPCVATSVDAQAELLGDVGIGVAVGDRHSLHAALQALIDMPAAKRATLAQRARQHALRNLTSKRAGARYLRLYEKLQSSAVAEIANDAL